jgi:hypothetical protein
MYTMSKKRSKAITKRRDTQARVKVGGEKGEEEEERNLTKQPRNRRGYVI